MALDGLPLAASHFELFPSSDGFRPGQRHHPRTAVSHSRKFCSVPGGHE
jgi:hypothetical protein